MQGSTVRALVIIGLCAAVSLVGARVRAGVAAGNGPEITPEIRAQTLHFAPEVAPADQAWILAAIAAARPEAQRLIGDVDGLVRVKTDLHAPGTIMPGAEGAIGLTHFDGHNLTIDFDLALLNGDRAIDRNMVVLHELGHVIDFVLVDDKTIAQLDAGIPPVGACQSESKDYGECTAVEERFADTFAKWALRGRFSLAGSGYGIPTPPSLEDWGVPLGRLAIQLDRQ
jgi:hypothetical protein